MYNNGPVTASSFSFQKRTAVPIKEAVAAFLLYFQSPLAVFLDFNSFPNILRPEFSLCSTHAYGILCGQRQSLAKAAPAKDLSFLDTQIHPAKSHFARQNHTAVVTTKTVYYYSCFFRRYPVKWHHQGRGEQTFLKERFHWSNWNAVCSKKPVDQL